MMAPMPASPRPASLLPPARPAATDSAWDDDTAYLALRTRDVRFDGRLFVGVTSTGIYCRPVCRVRPPRRENCRFFPHAALAEVAGFRPCLRCRPELAPGLSLTDSSEVLAHQAARWLTQAVHAGQSVELPHLAARLGVTDRHLRRIFQRSHGVTPMAWLSTQRLLLAKQLLTDTTMPVTDVALAAGFGSLRRFQAAFTAQYRLNPSALRRRVSESAAPAPAPARTSTHSRTGGQSPTSSLTAAHVATANAAAPGDAGAALWLGFRPPYDVAGVARFLARRALPGIETVEGDGGRLHLVRTLALDHQGRLLRGWLSAELRPERAAVRLTLAPALLPAAGALLQRCRQALDLDADPAPIATALAGLPGGARVGLRLPGTWDGFEAAVRVILGQQVTVAAAATLTRRLVQRFGEPIATPWPALDRLFPAPVSLSAADPAEIGTLGIVRQRVRALQALATEVAAGRLVLDRTAPLEPTLAALRALPGIGDWTAQLIAMRALAWPDAWLPTDIGVLNALGTRSPAEASARVEACRPWRAYAVMALWLGLEGPPAPGTDPAAPVSSIDPTDDRTVDLTGPAP
jgi:AraC family transcriptional regulator of adaptative response / DNA-3-methyladenine glycosylase II